MTSSIETSIIAYFDNHLSDAESAELLRQVNQSPELRRLFRQHEVLRSLVQRAQTNAVVDADTEAGLFSRLAVLKQQKRIAWFATPKFVASVAMVVGAFLSFGTYQLLSNKSVDRQPVVASVQTQTIPFNTAQHSSPLYDGRSNESSHVSGEQHIGISTSQVVQDISGPKSNIAQASAVAGVVKHSSFKQSNLGYAAQQPAATSLVSTSREIANTETIPQILAVPVVGLLSNKIAYNSQVVPISEYHPSEVGGDRALVEFSLRGSTEVLDARRANLFSGGRLEAGYFFTASDIVGLRVTATQTHLLPVNEASTFPKPSIGSDDFDHPYISQQAYEVFYEHQVLVLNGRLLISGSVSGGLMTGGNIFTAELGASLPITSRLMADVSFAAARTRVSEVQLSSPLSTATLWQPEDTHHAFSTRVYYGISYRM